MFMHYFSLNSFSQDIDRCDTSTVVANEPEPGRDIDHNQSRSCQDIIENKFLFIYVFCIAFNIVQIIPPWVVGRAETSTYSWSRFCDVNCRQMASNHQLSHLRLGQESNPDLRGGRRECYHSATMAP